MYQCLIEGLYKAIKTQTKIFITVFFTGACTLIFELAAARIVAPYYGTSIYTWTNVIGIILGSLSIGYWIGGRWADQKASTKLLATIVGLSGISMIAVYLIKGMVFGLLWQSITHPALGGLVSGLLLFTLPSFLFGAVSPVAIKLAIEEHHKIGQVAGNIYAISTLGSIIGTFAGGFFLIPLLGIKWVLLSLAILLIVLSMMLHLSSMKSIGITALLFFISTFFVKGHIRGVKQIETVYNHVKIHTDSSGHQTKKILRLNNYVSAAQYTDSDSLVFDYINFFRLDQTLRPDFKKVLFIGGSACTYPRHLLESRPDIEIHIVEIDQELIEIAHQEFDLPRDERLHFYHEDARTFLNRNEQKFDLIYVDVFNSKYGLPYQLTTREAIAQMKGALDSNGYILTNLLSRLDQTAFLEAEYSTYHSVFKIINLYQVSPDMASSRFQNICLIASDQATEQIPESFDAQTLTLRQDGVILTDDKAPVELLLTQ